MDHPEAPAQAPEAASSQPAELTIGDLAHRTGVSTAVLRMWESRHGFPVPQRLPSGHRRYTDADVELVRQVARRRDAGIRLEVAIAEASATRAPANPSIFAESAPPPPHAGHAPAAQVDPHRAVVGDRGRVLRGRRPPGALRRLPARGVLPPLRASVERA
ncbi:MerR family transcriptional regulator [Nocardioides sp. W3-2-3]|uniref:MerR family transcriptional regulator n=1 Tax=Nocardioides convexus TaxID=2712224 RepID=UPI0024184CA9|nr:MerR family transcriptional regulator [Nocardioides convexus]NHA00126.1 MerR family transcriptional regulator [Nocardioides convexus]